MSPVCLCEVISRGEKRRRPKKILSIIYYHNHTKLFIIMAYTNVCGKKLRAKLGGTLNESAASHSPALLPASQSFAKRQLEKMGWREGTGLGKRRDGMQRHVAIKQREDEMGLGREKEKAREIGNVWWKDSVGGTLARLQQQKKNKTKEKGEDGRDGDDEKKRRKDEKKREKKSKRTKSDEDGSSSISTSAIRTYTDEELFEATGGARFGMRAQRRAEGKWKRTESGSELEEMERKAKLNMEWNGRGSARAVIEEREASAAATTTIATGEKRKRRSDDDEDATATISPSISDEERDASAGIDAEHERRRSKKEEKKKKRKLERESTEMHHEASLSSTAFEEDGGSSQEEGGKKKKKKKTKMKEEKKSKKSSKKLRE